MKVVSGSILRVFMVAACCALLGGMLLSAKATRAVDPQAKATFESRCAACHGADGTGTPLGKSLQAADLRSDEIQKKPEAEMIEAVTNGKGNMPPFKDKLSADQIKAVIGYVRTLGLHKTK